MQAADRGVRVPGALGAVIVEDLGQPVGVVGEVLQPHRAILYEADRFPVALHGHHDVEAGLADLPDRLLLGWIDHLDHTVGEAEIAHQFDELGQTAQQIVAVLAGELDQQDGGRVALDELFDGLAEDRDIAGQVDHRLVGQFHRRRAQLDNMLGRVHRRVEIGEVADAQQLVRRHRREIEGDGGGEGEGAFRADQQVGQIDRRVAAFGDQRVDVVAADPAHQVGEAGGDLRLLAVAEGEQVARQPGGALVQAREVGGQGAEMHRRAVGQDRVDLRHVVAHGAVHDGARATAVVGGHASDRGAARGRDVDRKGQAVRRQRAIQLVEDDAGLDGDPTRRRVEVDYVVEMLADVDDQRLSDGLAALRRAAAARQDGHAFIGGDLQDAVDVLRRLWHHDADRLDLIVRGVGAVAAAAEGVEQHIAFRLAPQPRREGRVADCGGHLRFLAIMCSVNRYYQIVCKIQY